MNKITEANNLTPLNWLLRNDHQHVLDAVFHYLETQRNVNERKMARWALRCNQAPLHYTKLSTITIHRICVELGLTAIIIKNLVDNLNLNHVYVRKNIKKQNERKTALHIAASKGFANIIAFLLSKSAQQLSEMTRPAVVSKASKALNFFDGSGVCKHITPLHCAAQANHFEAAVLLVRAGASPFVRDSYNNSPLEYAVANGNEIMFEFFIEELNKNNYDQMTLNRALYQAICKGYNTYNKRLIQSGAKANSKGSVDNNSDNFDQEETRAMLIQDYQHQLDPNAVVKEWGIAGAAGFVGAVLGFVASFVVSDELSKTSLIGAAIGFILGAILGYSSIHYRNSLKRDVFLVPAITGNSNNNSERIPFLNKKAQEVVRDIE